MANPITIQHAQTGQISADKNYQAQRQNPELQQRLFEAEVRKKAKEAQDQTQNAAKTEKSHIRDKQEKELTDEQSKSRKKNKNKKPEMNAKTGENKIEKNEGGQILHLDVKV